jgi:ribosomal protein S8
MNIETIKFLTQLQNASRRNESDTTVNTNHLTFALIKLLYREGFIQSFSSNILDRFHNESRETMISIRYFHEQPAFRNLKIVSTPAKQRFLSLNVISRLSTKKKLFVFSTSKGLLTLEKCKTKHVGGVLLFVC